VRHFGILFNVALKVILPLNNKGKTMAIQVNIKQVYGVERIYPVNDQAIILTQLTKKKTLDRADINLIKKLGYDVEVVAEKI
jgi:hypothetical protein